MGHESIRKRRLKSEEIARNVRALISAAWTSVGSVDTLSRAEQCQMRWAGPVTSIQIQIRCRYWLHRGLLQQVTRASLEAKMV